MNSSTDNFEKAVHEINNAEWGNKIPNDRKLKCYAYYKQATVGDINIEQPPGLFKQLNVQNGKLGIAQRVLPRILLKNYM